MVKKTTTDAVLKECDNDIKTLDSMAAKQSKTKQKQNHLHAGVLYINNHFLSTSLPLAISLLNPLIPFLLPCSPCLGLCFCLL